MIGLNFMAAGLTGLSVIDDCPTVAAGIDCKAVTDCKNIVDDIKDEDGCVSAFIMTDVGQWVFYDYSENGTANYAQTTSGVGPKTIYTQTFTGQIEGVNKDVVAEANKLKECCCLVAVVYDNNCNGHVMGLETDPIKGTNKFSKMQASVATTTNTETDAADIATFTFQATAKCLSPITTVTKEELEAL